jgi:GAF domain-containing protein
MSSFVEMPGSNDVDPRVLDALSSLNQIGAAINRIGPGDSAHHLPSGQAMGASVASGGQVPSPAEGIKATLNLIVESATQVLPGASAVIYTYDQAQCAFDPASRVSAGEQIPPDPHDEPRPNGMGMRAISQRRRILSYEEEDLVVHPIKVHAGAKVVACHPLIVAEQAVGVLYVYLHQMRQFSQLELLMLENFVNQAGMTIYQTRQLANVQSDLVRKEDELSRLRRAGLLISSRLGLGETLEAILQMALEVTDARYGSFRLVDKSGQKLTTRAIAGECLNQTPAEALPIDASSIMGWVAKHRQPLCIHDLQAEQWAHIYRPLDVNLEMRSELAVPLIDASGRLEGVLNLESPEVGAFGEQDRHLLQALAAHAVIAIQEVRLLDALKEIALLLLTRSYQHVLNRLVELACELLNAAASAIWILEGDELILQVASAGYQRGERLPLHCSLAGEAITSRGPVVSNDVRADPRFHRVDLARAQGWMRALVAPLLASDNREPVGVFSVYSASPDPGSFAESEWDKKVLTCLADYAALAIHNAAHREALHAAQEQHAVAETFAAVGDIAANVLHHLNNKVGTIPARVQGIQDKCHSVVAAEPYLATNLAEIERSAREAMEAVRENLSHLHPILLSPVDVAACVTAAVKAANLTNGTRVRTEGLDDLPTVVAGQQSLTLVFVNLLENAANAMAGDGVVTIRGAAHDDWVEVAVSDSGPGITPELHERIFEFGFSDCAPVRVDASMIDASFDQVLPGHAYGRLGFGLWWVKTLMVRLGGSLVVESDGRHGSTFRLRLPRAEKVP